MSESTAELIAEAREYADAIQGGENENWMRLVTFVDSMADALEATTEQLAAAWDEGFDSGYDRVLVEKATASVATDYRHNPYRAEGADRG